MLKTYTEQRDCDQLNHELTKIRQECQHFVKWLADSAEMTTDTVCASPDVSLVDRQRGALDTLRRISNAIANPPQRAGVADRPLAGMTGGMG